MKKIKIPQTDSIQELARFWDTQDLMDELENVEEAVFARKPTEGKVRRGGKPTLNKKDGRRVMVSTPDVKQVRELFGLTQENFAHLLGIRLTTLQSWEQGRRQPNGPARLLLQVAAQHPETVKDALQLKSKHSIDCFA